MVVFLPLLQLLPLGQVEWLLHSVIVLLQIQTRLLVCLDRDPAAQRLPLELVLLVLLLAVVVLRVDVPLRVRVLQTALAFRVGEAQSLHFFLLDIFRLQLKKFVNQATPLGIRKLLVDVLLPLLFAHLEPVAHIVGFPAHRRHVVDVPGRLAKLAHLLTVGHPVQQNVAVISARKHEGVRQRLVFERLNNRQRVDQLSVCLDEPELAHLATHVATVEAVLHPVDFGDVPQLYAASSIRSQQS